MNALRWTPAVMLAIGAVITIGGVKGQRSMQLRAGLAETLPAELDGQPGRDIEISPQELAIAGPDAYVMRLYGADTTVAAVFSLYVGYYQKQAQGKSIHSPKNCLPGGGWEPLTNDKIIVTTPGGDNVVNRYVIQKGSARALVLYWYQGRGRIQANEYVVKWDLLRDAALQRRSEEALVRLVIWATDDIDEATQLAVRLASRVIPAVDTALPSA